jgi:uncharacterized membrane protein
MGFLILGLVILIGMHLVPAAPALHRRVAEHLGEGAYQVMFALISLAGFGLIIIGMGKVPFISLWEPPRWGYGLAPLLMLPACILLVGAYLPGNVHRITPHPMLWGVVLWAVGHLLANGDAASLLLFGALGLYSLFAMWSANRRGAVRASVKLSLNRDLVVIAVGVGLYITITILHPVLFGVAAVRGL